MTKRRGSKLSSAYRANILPNEPVPPVIKIELPAGMPTISPVEIRCLKQARSNLTTTWHSSTQASNPRVTRGSFARIKIGLARKLGFTDMENIRVTAESFPKPDSANVLNYMRNTRDFDISQYARVIEIQDSALPALFVGQTAMVAASQLVSKNAQLVVDGLDNLGFSQGHFPEDSTISISESLPQGKSFSACVMLDSITTCPSPITALADISQRLTDIAQALVAGSDWWFVIPNQLAEKLYGTEQERFTPAVKELPGNVYSRLAAQPESVMSVAQSLAGSHFAIKDIWSVSGFLPSPSSLTCIAGENIGQSTADGFGTIMAYPFIGREALQTQAHIGPTASSVLNAGWLVKATRTEAAVTEIPSESFTRRSFADELHYFIHHDQVADAGRILKSYFEQIIQPAFAVGNEDATATNRKEFNQRLVIHKSMGLAASITSLEDISRLIRADAFEQTTLVGDFPHLKVSRTWPESEEFISPTSSDISPTTYLALELKLFLSRWVFPNPPKWIRGNLNDRQLLEHLLGLCGIPEREINWVELDRVVAVLPLVLAYPRGLEINGIGANLEWLTGLYISEEAHREYMRKMWDLKRLVVRWRRRVILNRAKSFGVDEQKFVLLYRKITRTGPQAPKKKP